MGDDDDSSPTMHILAVGSGARWLYNKDGSRNEERREIKQKLLNSSINYGTVEYLRLRLRTP